MSSHVTLKGLRSTAVLVGLVAATSSLAGCSTFGMGAGDQLATGSIGSAGTSNLSQPMPQGLGASTRVADGPYTPPEDVGNGSNMPIVGRTYASLPPSTTSGSITSQDLPVIGGTTNGNTHAMSAQPAQSPLVQNTLAPKVASVPNLSVVQNGTYTHVIKSGESLYTIAKHYGVTAQAIMQASGIAAPDKIFVGQRVVIPGRPDLLAAMDNVALPSLHDKLPTDSNKPTLAAAEPLSMHPAAAAAEPHIASLEDMLPTVPRAGRALASATGTVVPLAHGAAAAEKPLAAARPLAAAAPALTLPSAASAHAPVQTASTNQQAPKAPLQEPAMSGAEKFRWPVSGKVIVDFAASKGTGINIAAPEGTPVKAAENGTVIYVGSGVEGYGNLILIRHANGYVSAYANLKDMNVQKGAVVSRGDTIGSAGTTGSVSSPQLHFELRKGATPVDPVPLLG